MTVDPLVPNCVWFMTRFKVCSAGSHTCRASMNS